MTEAFNARRAGRFRVAAAAWTCLLLVLFWLPGVPSALPFVGADKVAHAGLFFVFGALTVRGVPLRPAPRWSRWMWTMLAAAILAALSEVGQELLTAASPGWTRHGDPLDALADLAGAGLGALTGKKSA